MLRSSWLRRALKWTGTVLSLLILATLGTIQIIFGGIVRTACFSDVYYDFPIDFFVLGLVLLPIALPTAWLWHRDRRRIPPGHCPGCGYNLTGNTSGVCSECGKPTPAR